jgi:hypothetical protein
MPTTVYVDPTHDDAWSRDRLYDGQLVVYSARPSIAAIVDHARVMLEDAFAPLQPLSAQYEIPVERWVEIFAALKPRFMHDVTTLRLLSAVLADLGWNPDEWYVDVPRFRGVTSHGYLTTGVGYAHHPHRDTWWSAPMQQINLWMPIYDYEGSSGMEFYPEWWAREVPNSSDEFDYYDWNANGRAAAATMIGADTRKQPIATVPIELGEKLRLVVPVGGAQVFAACQYHGAVGNDTGVARFSLDWRVVNLADLRAGRAPVNRDTHSRGTSLRDFRRARDLEPMPADVVARYDHGYAGDDHEGKVLVFKPA